VAERLAVFPRLPAFVRDYHGDYKGLKELEDNAAVVRQECLELLGIKEKLTDGEALGGSYTAGGIHAIRWKSFMFKSGEFIESNCAMAPRTATLLKGIRSTRLTLRAGFTVEPCASRCTGSNKTAIRV